MGFFSKIRKIIYTPVNPSFAIKKWGLRGSKLYRYVFVMHFNITEDFGVKSCFFKNTHITIKTKFTWKNNLTYIFFDIIKYVFNGLDYVA